MVRLSQFEESERRHLLDLPCPTYPVTPSIGGIRLSEARVALVSTAGLHRRGDRPFAVGESGYRIISKDCRASDLVMSHVSKNFDRTGFQQDLNMVFPLDRLNELVADGMVGSLAHYHYSFMGATDPTKMKGEARQLCKILHNDRVTAVLLVPV
jgi:D-proline reductase (dithiol) PrdB